MEHISKPPEGSNTNEVQSREYFEKTFKLADPGFAKFVKKNTKTSAVPKEQLLGGTDAFGKHHHFSLLPRDSEFELLTQDTA